MPRGMKLKRVDPLARRAVRGKLGRVAVGEFGERERLGRGERRAVTQQCIAMPRGAVAFERGRQRRVARKQVVVRERRDLVGDLVGLAEAMALHLLSPFAVSSTAVWPCAGSSRGRWSLRRSSAFCLRVVRG